MQSSEITEGESQKSALTASIRRRVCQFPGEKIASPIGEGSEARTRRCRTVGGFFNAKKAPSKIKPQTIRSRSAQGEGVSDLQAEGKFQGGTIAWAPKGNKESSWLVIGRAA